MPEFPETVLAIISKHVKANKDDIQQTVENALAEIKKLKNFDDLVNELLFTAVQELVYRARSQQNLGIRNQGSEQKVQVGQSDSVRRVERSYLNYFVGGRTLGNLMGKELNDLALVEEATGQGHLFNAKLLKSLSKIVPVDKKVRDAVSERKLRQLFTQLQRAAK